MLINYKTMTFKPFTRSWELVIEIDARRGPQSLQRSVKPLCHLTSFSH